MWTAEQKIRMSSPKGQGAAVVQFLVDAGRQGILIVIAAAFICIVSVVVELVILPMAQAARDVP